MLGVAAAALMGLTAPTAACPTDPLAPAEPRAVAIQTSGGARYGRISYPDQAPLSDREIALTFDDGPDDANTLHVLEILKRHCIRATFFLVGQEVDADPDTTRAIVAAGHTVGAHSQTHPDDMAALPLAAARTEIDLGFQAIDRALAPLSPDARARRVPMFRFPSLKDSQALLAELKARDIAAISADVDIDDWDETPSEEILRLAIIRVIAQRHAVMLLHDYNPQMSAVLDRLITALEMRGYRFVQLTAAR